MIKILQVLPTLNRGGLETFVMNVYRAIDRNVVQFEFLTYRENGDYMNEIKDMGGIIYHISERNKGIMNFNRELDTFFKRHEGEYSAIHCHASSLSSIEPLYYAKKYGIPIRIIHSHSSSILGNKLHFVTHCIGKALISSLANRYIGCSDKALDWMFAKTKIRKDAVIVRNGIDINLFKYNEEIRKRVRKDLGLSDNDIVVGHIGRFSAVKNHSMLIDIFADLKRKVPTSKLLLVGVGELEMEIMSKVRVLNLQDSVSFLGLRTDTAVLYQAMDIFVMPSIYEGLPLVLIEAQATGLPVLCSNSISHMSKITNNYNELSIRDDISKWSSQIINIVKNYKRKDEHLSIVKAGFDINTVADYLTDLYGAKKI